MAEHGRLDELSRKFDENPRRYFAPLANEYRKVGNFDRAIELCRTYLPHQPEHMSGYIVYGQSLFDAGSWRESAEIFQQALRLDPENLIALRHLGDIAREWGDKALAMQWYGRVLELDPKSEEIMGIITGLATPSAAGTPAAPSRPPTIRPEPELDPNAVALADLVGQPDRPQQPFQEPVSTSSYSESFSAADEIPASTSAVEHAFERLDPVIDVLPSEDAQDLASGDIYLASVSAPEDLGSAEITEPEAVESLQAMEQALHADVALSSNDDEPLESTPNTFDDAFRDVSYEAFATAPMDMASDLAVSSTSADASVTPHDDVPSTDDMASADSHLDDVATVSAIPGASAFVTETMASLYLQQGFVAEALDVYRKLAATRDEAHLHAKVHELEQQLAGESTSTSTDSPHVAVDEPHGVGHHDDEAVAHTPSRETVRAFFARLGARRPGDAVAFDPAQSNTGSLADVAASPRGGGLSSLFASTPSNPDDDRAAASLGGAFNRQQADSL